MKFHKEIKKILVFCVFALFLFENVYCKGGTGGGGGGGRGGVGGRAARAGMVALAGVAGVAGLAGVRGVRSAPKSSSLSDHTNNGAGNPTSKVSGAYLIPANGAPFPVYRTQEVTSYYKREGSGISAWGIIALILGVLGSGTAAWFCYMVGLPIWRDRRRRHHSLIQSDPLSRRTQDATPLQATPSTATPSP